MTPPAVGREYAGLVTRTLAFAIDAAIINGVGAVTGVVMSLVFSVVPESDQARAIIVAISGLVFVCWGIAYFVTFWATTGETPGNRVMHIRVMHLDGSVLRPRQAVLRLGALVVATLPLCAGLIPILFSDRRQGLHDFAAGTAVAFRVESPSQGQAAVLVPAR